MRMTSCIVTTLLIVLALLHHDFWFWSDRSLVFEWIPIGLAWHVSYAVLASAIWAVIVSMDATRSSEEDTP